MRATHPSPPLWRHQSTDPTSSKGALKALQRILTTLNGRGVRLASPESGRGFPPLRPGRTLSPKRRYPSVCAEDNARVNDERIIQQLIVRPSRDEHFSPLSYPAREPKVAPTETAFSAARRATSTTGGSPPCRLLLPDPRRVRWRSRQQSLGR
jgi:hypothetical protein